MNFNIDNIKTEKIIHDHCFDIHEFSKTDNHYLLSNVFYCLYEVNKSIIDSNNNFYSLLKFKTCFNDIIEIKIEISSNNMGFINLKVNNKVWKWRKADLDHSIGIEYYHKYELSNNNTCSTLGDRFTPTDGNPT